jgi:C_GCAxxG_C_C family probable redox protein
MNQSKQEALELFKTKHNCCQAVIGGLHNELNMDKETALRVGAAFGGGMARQGRTCGVVVGAYMAMGMYQGELIKNDNNKLKAVTNDMTKIFNAAFEKEFGSTLCKDLLGVDLGTTEGAKIANETGLFDSHCPKYVGRAVEIMQEMMK